MSTVICEYRIPLPLEVHEYCIGQLYMVAKISRNSKPGEGVQILANEPYATDDEKGQFTHKIFYPGSNIPGWMRKITPSSMVLEERAWNAFPKCKTEMTSPFVSKMKITIQTMHLADDGTTENATGLTPEELKLRKIDYIDIALDAVPKEQYKAEEDPTKFVSKKTGRGPLGPGWQGKVQPRMTIYKVVKIYYDGWFKSTVQNFILKFQRGLFQNSHRQLWCWVDEWFGLTMADIRRIEAETAAAVARIKQPSARYLLEKGPSQKQLNVNSPGSPRAGPMTPRSPAVGAGVGSGTGLLSSSPRTPSARRLNFDSAASSASPSSSTATAATGIKRSQDASAKSTAVSAASASPQSAAATSASQTGSQSAHSHSNSHHSHSHHHHHSHRHHHRKDGASSSGSNGNSTSAGSTSDEPPLSQADDEALLLARLRGLPIKHAAQSTAGAAAAAASSPNQTAAAATGKSSFGASIIKHASANKPSSDEELSVSHNAAVWSERTPWHVRFASLVSTLGIVSPFHAPASSGSSEQTALAANAIERDWLNSLVAFVQWRQPAATLTAWLLIAIACVNASFFFPFLLCALGVIFSSRHGLLKWLINIAAACSAVIAPGLVWSLLFAYVLIRRTRLFAFLFDSSAGD